VAPTRAAGRTATEVLLTSSVLVALLSDFRVARFLALALPLGAVLVLLRTDGARLMAVRVPLAVLGFLTWACVSWFWSADRASTVSEIIELGIIAVPAMVAGVLLGLDRVRVAVTRAVKLMLAVSVTVLLVAPGWATAPNPGDPAPGWSATFSHKNGLGFFCLYAAVALFFDGSRWRWAWLLATVVLLVGSQSSTALALVVAVTGIVMWRSSTQAFLATHQKSAYRLLSLTALAFGGAALLTRPSLATDALGRDLSLTGRTDIWLPVQRQIRQHVEVGLGWGGVWRPASRPTLEMWREARFEAFYAHNGYLDIMLQLGAVGAVLFLLVLGGTLWRLVRMPATRGPLWSVFLLTVLTIAAVTESGPFTSGIGLLSILVIAASAMQRQEAGPPLDPGAPELLPGRGTSLTQTSTAP
jgi:O-antigen ligase